MSLRKKTGTSDWKFIFYDGTSMIAKNILQEKISFLYGNLEEIRLEYNGFDQDVINYLIKNNKINMVEQTFETCLENGTIKNVEKNIYENLIIKNIDIYSAYGEMTQTVIYLEEDLNKLE